MQPRSSSGTLSFVGFGPFGREGFFVRGVKSKSQRPGTSPRQFREHRQQSRPPKSAKSIDRHFTGACNPKSNKSNGQALNRDGLGKIDKNQTMSGSGRFGEMV